jgi:hypothetical protein
MSSEWQHRARELDRPSGPRVERDAVDETQAGNPVRKPDGDGLRHAASNVVTYQTREVDSEVVQYADDPVGMRSEIYATRIRRIAASVTQQIEDDHSMSRGQERYDATPQMA